jgi:hypothetical protein
MRVRAVRESVYGWHDGNDGTPFVAFEWPTDAPAPFDKPEAALKEWRWTLPSVFSPLRGRVVSVPCFFLGRWWVTMEENGGGTHRVCLSDIRPMEERKERRHGQRRKGERRMICSDRDWVGGRRERRSRRTGTDRRKP